MKNFTNNFKQFTSRLSARWLIMVLMLLLGTSSAWAADLYIKGNPDAKIWIWTSSKNYTGGEWNNRPQLQNTDYFTKIEANIYKYTKSNTTLPDKISIKINDQADIKDVDNISTKYIDADANKAKDKEGLDLECSIVNSESIVIEVESSINPYIWAWQDDTSETKLVKNTVWPGDKLNGESNVYSVEYKPTTSTISIIFTNNKNYQTPDIKNLKVGKRYRFSYNGSKSNLYEIKQIECLESLCIDSDDVNPGTVNVKPANDKYCAGENYKLSINPTAIGGYTTTIQWQKKDGNNYSNVGSNSTSLNLEGLAAGTYTYRATVTWTKGTCTVTESTADKSFTVNALPSAPGLGNSASSQCVTANGTVNLNTLASPVGTVYWYDSSSQLISNATVSIATAGTFTYTAKAVSNGCESTSGTSFELTVKYNANASNYSIKAGSESKDYTGSELGLTKEEIVVSNNAGTVSTIYFKQNGNTVNPINVGEYDVYVTTVATDDICAGDIKIGTFTINKATQDELFISNEQAKYCGLPTQDIALTTEGGTTAGTLTFTSDDESVATIENNNQLRVIKEGSVNITATMAGNDNYEPITSEAKQFTFYKAPDKPTDYQVVNIQKCKDGSTNGKIVINNVSPAYVYTINPAATGNAKDGFVISNARDYIVTVTRTVDGCSMSTESDPITVRTDNNTPDATVSISGEASFCEGGNTTLTCNTADVKGQITAYQWYNGSTLIQGATTNTYTTSAAGNYKVEVTVINSDCEKTFDAEVNVEVNELPKYPALGKTSASLCQSNETEDLDKLAEINDVVWYIGENEVNNAHTISLATAGTTIYTAKAVDANGCQSATGAEFVLRIDAQPTFTAPAATQTNKEITLESAAGASTQWSVSPTENVTLTDNDDGTAAFVATANGDYTITASNGVCAQVSHTIKVSDAFYIWVRKPIKGEEAYEQFYHKDQNSSEVIGGMMYYKEYANIPPADGYQDYNKDGRKADLERKDCNGYTWYGYKASEDMVAGNRYFTVHAPNDGKGDKGTAGQYGGYYTHTYATNPGAMTSDIYYTMNEDASGNPRGWYITNVSAPYAGPMVHASGDAKFNANNFADFVSLYVTDCSGNEVTGYQWNYTAPTCTYIGKETVTMSASTSNNIRVREAGNYTCTVKYKDGTTATSAALAVSADDTDTPSLEEFTSNLPIIMVNTNGEGFPDCTGLSGQTASKNASTLKAKRSVDVIIKDGTDIIYDRKARMNYRGSSSLNFVKKSYAFCPGEANCEEKDGKADYVKTAKLNMLGLGEAYDKDWVLYAAAADPSLMRNRLVFDSYAAMTGKWSVQSRYVELIVDGVYKGVYLMMDKITMNKNRVKVDEDKGFIVKFDKTDKEDRIGGLNGIFGDEKTFKTDNTGKYDIGTYDTSVDQLFEIEYPEKDDYPTGWSSRTTAIKNMFNNFEKALKDGDFTTVQQYIDYTSWADWFIINEYTKNVDAYRASCIFVYTGEAGAKIEARPLWDQELSFNNAATTVGNGKGCNITSGLLIQNDGVYSDAFPAPFWFTGGGSSITGGLLNDPCFVQVVKERWEMHKTGALSEASLQGRITEYYNDLADYDESTKTYAQKSAKTREEAFWTGKSRKNCDCSYDTSNKDTATGYYDLTIDNSKGTMDTWVLDAQRRAGLSTAISGLTGTTMNIQIIPTTIEVTPWEAATITINKSDGYDYTLENDLDGVSGVVVQENGNSITYRIPRPSDWGYGDGNGNDIREDKTYTIKATLNVASGTMVCGTTAAPNSTATIILQDEEDENCDE